LIRSIHFATLLAGITLSSATARADDKADCVAAHERGQIARRTGRFDNAREDFAVCQRPQCPAILQARCSDLARELDAAQPTIVVFVRDTLGADVLDARIAVDGAAPASVGTLAVGHPVNPGVHVIRVEASGFPTVDKTFTVPEAAKSLLVSVVLERPTAPPPRAPPPQSSGPGPSRAVAWTFAIGSGVALAGAGTLSAVGWGIHSHLSSSCGTTCTDSQVAPLRIIWPASFLSLGVGVAAGVAAIILVAHHDRESTSALVLGPAGVGARF
jgi:hypothetical protein